MEPKFKTSFIPKASLAETGTEFTPHKRHGSGFGIGTFIAFVIFLLAIGATALVFIYKQVLEGQVVSKTEDLNRAKEAFKPTTIEEMARLDQRIEAVKMVLEKHIAPSTIFSMLEATTLLSVQYERFSYRRLPDGTMFVFMEGSGRDYAAVALQSDEFAKNRFFQNPIIENPQPNAQGRVSFEFRAEIDPRLLAYQKVNPGVSPPSDSFEETGSPENSSDAMLGDSLFGESQ